LNCFPSKPTISRWPASCSSESVSGFIKRVFV
jgi:hypothetical protein